MLDLKAVKFGARPARLDPRTLAFAPYLKPGTLPAAPDEQNWDKILQHLGMMKNDVFGDCTCAGMGHLVQTWTANHGKEIVLPDFTIVDVYEQVCPGFDASTDANDNGACLIDVLRFVASHSFVGHKIAAYVSIDPKNLDHVREAIYLFGGVYAGFTVPSSIDKQGNKWSVVDPNGPVEGGHCVPLTRYSKPDKSLGCLSWGDRYDMTEDFFTTYFTEVYGIVSMDWVSPAMVAPNRFDFSALMNDRRGL